MVLVKILDKIWFGLNFTAVTVRWPLFCFISLTYRKSCYYKNLTGGIMPHGNGQWRGWLKSCGYLPLLPPAQDCATWCYINCAGGYSKLNNPSHSAPKQRADIPHHEAQNHEFALAPLYLQQSTRSADSAQSPQLRYKQGTSATQAVNPQIDRSASILFILRHINKLVCIMVREGKCNTRLRLLEGASHHQKIH